MGNVKKFDTMASQYDSAERAANAKIISQEIRRHIGIAAGKSALDYGCGTGLVGLNLLDLFESMLFVDAAPNMIEVVKEKLAALNIANPANSQTLCLDLETEQTLERRFDYILVVQTLLHIKNTEHIVLRLHDLLNSGGHLIIVDFDKTEGIVTPDIHHGFNQEDLTNVALKMGFKSAAAHTFYSGKRMLAGKDSSLFLLDAVR